MSRNFQLDEPLLINEENDHGFEYRVFINENIPLTSKSLKLNFPMNIWLTILEYIDYIWNELSLDDINRYLVPIFNSPIEILIHTSSDQFSELESAYYYDGLNLSQKIKISLQFIEIFTAFSHESYKNESKLMDKFIDKITRGFECLPAEQALLKQDNFFQCSRQDRSGDTNYMAYVAKIRMKLLAGMILINLGKLLNPISNRTKLLERRILINFIRLLGPKPCLFSEAKNQDIIQQYQKRKSKFKRRHTFYGKLAIFALITIAILWLSYFLSDLKSRDEERDRSWNPDEQGIKFKNLFIALTSIMGLGCLVCSCAAADKPDTTTEMIADPNPIPASPVSSISIAKKIIIENNIFFTEEKTSSIGFQIIKNKLEKITQEEEHSKSSLLGC